MLEGGVEPCSVLDWGSVSEAPDVVAAASICLARAAAEEEDGDVDSAQFVEDETC